MADHDVPQLAVVRLKVGKIKGLQLVLILVLFLDNFSYIDYSSSEEEVVPKKKRGARGGESESGSDVSNISDICKHYIGRTRFLIDL